MHFWLFRGEGPEERPQRTPLVAEPFRSLSEARTVAVSLGGDVDIYGTLPAGGGWQLIEHIARVVGR